MRAAVAITLGGVLAVLAGVGVAGWLIDGSLAATAAVLTVSGAFLVALGLQWDVTPDRRQR